MNKKDTCCVCQIIYYYQTIDESFYRCAYMSFRALSFTYYRYFMYTQVYLLFNLSIYKALKRSRVKSTTFIKKIRLRSIYFVSFNECVLGDINFVPLKLNHKQKCCF